MGPVKVVSLGAGGEDQHFVAHFRKYGKLIILIQLSATPPPPPAAPVHAQCGKLATIFKTNWTCLSNHGTPFPPLPPLPRLLLLPWLANYLKLKLLPFATARQKNQGRSRSKAKLLLKALHYG